MITNTAIQSPGIAFAPLKRNQVHLWIISLPETSDRQPFPQNLLDEMERARANGFRFDRDRRRFIFRRTLLRLLIAEYTGIKPAVIQFDETGFGKPILPGNELQFNVSHSRNRLIMGFRLKRRLGVDIEYINPNVMNDVIINRYFAPGEKIELHAMKDHNLAFFTGWTRKEAYLKATGTGLIRDLDTFELPMNPDLYQFTVNDPDQPGRQWAFHTIDCGCRDFTACLAYETEENNVDILSRRVDMNRDCFDNRRMQQDQLQIS